MASQPRTSCSWLRKSQRAKFICRADGISFTIHRVEKPGKSGPKTYWLWEGDSTGKRRSLNNVSREIAEGRAEQIKAAMDKRQAHGLCPQPSWRRDLRSWRGHRRGDCQETFFRTPPDAERCERPPRRIIWLRSRRQTEPLGTDPYTKSRPCPRWPRRFASSHRRCRLPWRLSPARQ